MAALLQPIVLEVSTIADVIDFILERHSGASTLVVCTSKAEFISWIKQDAITRAQDTDDAHQQRPPQDRFAPTLRLLSRSQTVQLAFCPEVAHLRAYLSVYSAKFAERQPVPASEQAAAARDDGVPILAILNPLRLHKQTSNFSAQSLNRFIATGIDAAYLSKSKLVLAEVPISGAEEQDEEEELHRAMTPASSDDIETPTTPRDLWQAQVSIMNVSTKTFGAGEQGWAGRTVQVKTIAQRWCVFEQYPASSQSV